MGAEHAEKQHAMRWTDKHGRFGKGSPVEVSSTFHGEFSTRAVSTFREIRVIFSDVLCVCASGIR